MRRLPSSDTGSFPLAPCSNVRHCNATAIQMLSVEHAGSIRTGAELGTDIFGPTIGPDDFRLASLTPSPLLGQTPLEKFGRKLVRDHTVAGEIGVDIGSYWRGIAIVCPRAEVRYAFRQLAVRRWHHVSEVV